MRGELWIRGLVTIKKLVSRVESPSLQSSLSRVFDCTSNWVFNPAQPHIRTKVVNIAYSAVIAACMQNVRIIPHMRQSIVLQGYNFTIGCRIAHVVVQLVTVFTVRNVKAVVGVILRYSRWNMLKPLMQHHLKLVAPLNQKSRQSSRTPVQQAVRKIHVQTDIY